jgi:hypothetical protein
VFNGEVGAHPGQRHDEGLEREMRVLDEIEARDV